MDGVRTQATPTGTTVGAGAIVLAMLGWALGHAAVSAIAAACAAALVFGWFATRRVARLDVERDVRPVRVQRGAGAHATLRITATGGRGARPTRLVEPLAIEPAVAAGDRAGSVELEVPALAAGAPAELRYDLPTGRRGSVRIGPATVVRRDPFGLWESRRVVGATTTMLVQPRLHPIDPRTPGRERHVEGPTSDTAPRGTLTFHSLREYTPGDDIRRVHWRSTARTGTLMVREHVDTSLPTNVVVLDVRAAAYTADGFEDAVDVAASIVSAAQALGHPVRLVTTRGESLVVRAGQRGQQLHDFLAGVACGDEGGMGAAAAAVVRGHDHDSIAVITGAIAAGELGAVTAITRRFARPTLVSIVADTADTVRWPGGRHVVGRDATDVVARWSAGALARGRV